MQFHTQIHCSTYLLQVFAAAVLCCSVVFEIACFFVLFNCYFICFERKLKHLPCHAKNAARSTGVISNLWPCESYCFFFYFYARFISIRRHVATLCFSFGYVMAVVAFSFTISQKQTFVKSIFCIPFFRCITCILILNIIFYVFLWVDCCYEISTPKWKCWLQPISICVQCMWKLKSIYQMAKKST